MKFITVSELKNKATQIVTEIATKRREVVVTKNGRPVVLMRFITDEAFNLKEDEKGLAIEIDPPDTQIARDLLVSMERGDVTQMSFGFSVRPDGQNWAEDDEGRVIRTLTNVRLFDVSPVVFPAYPQTDIAVREMRAFLAAKKPNLTPLAMRKRQLELIERT